MNQVTDEAGGDSVLAGCDRPGEWGPVEKIGGALENNVQSGIVADVGSDIEAAGTVAEGGDQAIWISVGKAVADEGVRRRTAETGSGCARG